MKKNTAIIIQARTGSTRLPNKMILPFYKDKGILEIILTRINKKYSKKYKIILATTTNKNDNKIEEIGKKIGIDVYRGSETNVLKRFIDTAIEYDAESIVRVCADNPLLEIEHIENLINEGVKNNYDYVSYKFNENTPVIKSHLGLFTEYTNVKTLKKVIELTNDKYYFEHVTNYIYENDKSFNIKFLDLSKELYNKQYRFTLDTIEDFTTLQKIYSDISEEKLSLRNIVEYVEQNLVLKEKMLTQIKQNTK